MLIADGHDLALMERHRDGRHYWVAPGGGVELAEPPEAAAAREALEELGLRVEIHHKVLQLHGLHPSGRVEHFFLATSAKREFGEMTGPERPTSSNTYAPRWVHLREVESLNVLPQELKAFLGRVVTSGWPDEALVVR